MAGVSSATDTESIDIHSAVKRNDEVQIKKYVCRGGDLEARDKDALTPLHVASAGGSAAVVEYLIKKGARVDSVSKIGHTPLHLACRFGHLPVVLLLLANHAELNSRDKDENTPLHKAASNGKALLCRELVKRGADIDARNDTAYTPLHWACFKGHKAAAEQLLKCGANINATSSRRATALFMSAYYGHADVTLLLLAWGADSAIANEDGVKPGDNFFSEVTPAQQEQTRRLFADRQAILMKGYEATRRNMALMYMRSERSDLHLQHSQGEVEALWDKLAKREKELNMSKVGARDLSHAVKAMKTALEKARQESKALKAKIATLEADLEATRAPRQHGRDEVGEPCSRGRKPRRSMDSNVPEAAAGEAGEPPGSGMEGLPPRDHENEDPSRTRGARCAGAASQLKGQSSEEYSQSPVTPIKGMIVDGIGDDAANAALLLRHAAATNSLLSRRETAKAHLLRSSSFSSSENGLYEECRESPRRNHESPRRTPLHPTRSGGEGCAPTPPCGPSPTAMGIRRNSHFGRSVRSRSPSPVPVPVPAGNVAAHASAINTRVAELGMTGVVPLPPVKSANIGDSGSGGGGGSGITRTGSWSSLLLGMSGPMVVGGGHAPRTNANANANANTNRGSSASEGSGTNGKVGGIVGNRAVPPSPPTSTAPDISKYARSFSSASASAVLMRSSEESDRPRQKSGILSPGVNGGMKPGSNNANEASGSDIRSGGSHRDSVSGTGARHDGGLSVTGIRGRGRAPGPSQAVQASSSAAVATMAHLVGIEKQALDSSSDSGEDTVPVSPESSSRDQE